MWNRKQFLELRPCNEGRQLSHFWLHSVDVKSVKTRWQIDEKSTSQAFDKFCMDYNSKQHELDESDNGYQPEFHSDAD